MTTKSNSKSWSWRGKPPGIDTLHVRKPPTQANPSVTSQANKQTRPITLAKVWDK